MRTDSGLHRKYCSCNYHQINRPWSWDFNLGVLQLADGLDEFKVSGVSPLRIIQSLWCEFYSNPCCSHSSQVWLVLDCSSASVPANSELLWGWSVFAQVNCSHGDMSFNICLVSLHRLHPLPPVAWFSSLWSLMWRCVPNRNLCRCWLTE